ncbi:unnamed protein product [Heligmosomoides polygyrus]|uniref:Uncharacterized protein n=1 Tax=Heligmosomoides polygyrus TaxID=6339 RepID=A0A3P7VL10_HELPZ|nr:unnamed protein product [Heligmosomoides polygyrus]
MTHNGVDDEPGWEKRIMISAEAHLVFGVHAQVDGRHEASLAQNQYVYTVLGKAGSLMRLFVLAKSARQIEE